MRDRVGAREQEALRGNPKISNQSPILEYTPQAKFKNPELQEFKTVLYQLKYKTLPPHHPHKKDIW
jgi:hypothetical protein